MWTLKQERKELFGPLSGSGPQFQKAQGKDGTLLRAGSLVSGEARPGSDQEEQRSCTKKGLFPPQCISGKPIRAKRNTLG